MLSAEPIIAGEFLSFFFLTFKYENLNDYGCLEPEYTCANIGGKNK